MIIIGTVRPILKFPEKVLTRITRPVLEWDDDLTQLIADLRATAAKPPWGQMVGLAANQIGVDQRVCLVLRDIVINPVILKTSNEKRWQNEGCYSLEDKKFNYRVQRHRWIEAEWCDERGEMQKRRMKGYEARVFQHECDHLFGLVCSGQGKSAH